MKMTLRVMLPHRILLDEEVDKVVAEGGEGSFGLLPLHADFASALVPGLLSYREAGSGVERFLAVDEGILVKCGGEVLVSTRHAVAGGDLGELRATVDGEFLALTEQERKTRSAMARLELSLARRFIDFGRK